MPGDAEVRFDPDVVWGAGRWVAHVNCPAALSVAGRPMTVTHSKAFHGRPLVADRDAVICTMCEDAPATTTRGLPVCQDCADGLVETQAMLEEMEAEDPHLAELGRRVEESARAWLAEQEGRDAR